MTPINQPLKLQPGVAMTVAQVRLQIAELLRAAPEEVFLVADDVISKALLPFRHKPDLANERPVAELVPHGATVSVQIGRRGLDAGPFIQGTPAASEPTQLGTDSYKISTRTVSYCLTPTTLRTSAALLILPISFLSAGVKATGTENTMSNELEVVARATHSISAEISNATTDGKRTTMNNIVAGPEQLTKRKKIEIMGRAGILDGLSAKEKAEMFMNI